MEINLTIGMSYSIEKIVDEKDSAASLGSGLVPVFSTPSMILLMEEASQMAVQNFLDDGLSTVGTLVNIQHLAATPVGFKVCACAKLIEITGRRLVFEVEAFDTNGIIGKGLHERAVIDVERFMSKLKERNEIQ